MREGICAELDVRAECVRGMSVQNPRQGTWQQQQREDGWREMLENSLLHDDVPQGIPHGVPLVKELERGRRLRCAGQLHKEVR